MASGTESGGPAAHSCPPQNDEYPSDRQIRELNERIGNLQRWSSFLDGLMAGCVIAVFISSLALLAMKGCR